VEQQIVAHAGDDVARHRHSGQDRPRAYHPFHGRSVGLINVYHIASFCQNCSS
jgi:hypothetical protein